ncbi:MAG: type II secretion system major pseudopilin GspG [Bryobacteraceae bacterium]|nr:type II secretion system major pseudopilin GspG [Bryobacteraceae bacterium]
MDRKRLRRQAGVTLIEMLVVVTIIALFAALVAPRMLQKSDAARVTAARAQINSFMTALGAYKLDTGVYPTTEEGLQALRRPPQNVRQWQGPYLPQEIPDDPWGTPYAYRFPSEQGGNEPEIISYGADRQPGGTDINADIVSWKSH